MRTFHVARTPGKGCEEEHLSPGKKTSLEIYRMPAFKSLGQFGMVTG